MVQVTIDNDLLRAVRDPVTPPPIQLISSQGSSMGYGWWCMGPEAIRERNAKLRAAGQQQEAEEETKLATVTEIEEKVSQGSEKTEQVAVVEKKVMTAEEKWAATKGNCAGSWKEARADRV